MKTVKRGEYQLAEQRGELGYFAKVVIQVTQRVGAHDLSLHFNTEDHPWKAAIGFCIAYAWEHFSRSARPNAGISVQVVDVQWQIGDTTTAGMAFASAHALWDALTFVPDRPASFEVQSATFCFPN